MDSSAEGRTKHGPGEQRRCKYPSGADCHGHRDDLGHHEHEEQPETVISLEGLLHGRIANPEDLRKEEADGSEEQPAWDRLQVLGYVDIVEYRSSNQ